MHVLKIINGALLAGSAAGYNADAFDANLAKNASAITQHPLPIHQAGFPNSQKDTFTASERANAISALAQHYGVSDPVAAYVHDTRYTAEPLEAGGVPLPFKTALDFFMRLKTFLAETAVLKLDENQYYTHFYLEHMSSFLEMGALAIPLFLTTEVYGYLAVQAAARLRVGNTNSENLGYLAKAIAALAMAERYSITYSDMLAHKDKNDLTNLSMDDKQQLISVLNKDELETYLSYEHYLKNLVHMGFDVLATFYIHKFLST